MPDAKEWEKIIVNLVQTKNWIYKFHDEYEQDYEINEDIQIIRFLLDSAVEKLERLAKWDDKGWFKSEFGDE